MPKASEIAAELRKFADRLDSMPDVKLVKPYIHFSHTFHANPKEIFLSLVKVLPRPLKKSDGYTRDEMKVEYTSAALDISGNVAKSATCRIVTPAQEAVYECEPILSQEELAEVEA